jgi:hypothetical protein
MAMHPETTEGSFMILGMMFAFVPTMGLGKGVAGVTPGGVRPREGVMEMRSNGDYDPFAQRIVAVHHTAAQL